MFKLFLISRNFQLKFYIWQCATYMYKSVTLGWCDAHAHRRALICITTIGMICMLFYFFLLNRICTLEYSTSYLYEISRSMKFCFLSVVIIAVTSNWFALNSYLRIVCLEFSLKIVLFFTGGKHFKYKFLKHCFILCLS